MEKKKELYVNEQVYDEVISRQEQNEDEGFGSRINEADRKSTRLNSSHIL